MARIDVVATVLGRDELQWLDVTMRLPGLTTKLAEARGGEPNAAPALRKMRLVLERTLIRAEADALNATTRSR